MIKKINIDFENEKWIIERVDKWRVYNSSRSSIVLSANAILLTGILFILEKIIKFISLANPFLFYFQIFLIFFLIILLLISFYFASIGIVNVFTPSRKKYGAKMPDRIYFHPTDVVNNCDSFTDFVTKYSNYPEEKIREALWAELWTVINLQYTRYQYLRKSVACLILSIPIFFINICLIIIALINRNI